MKIKHTGSQRPIFTYAPTLSKFPKDQICFEDASFQILLEGYVLNHQALLAQNPGLCLREILCRAYQQGGFAAVPGLLRGSFVLAFEDKQSGTAYLANDLLSKKPLFYLLQADTLLADTSFQALVDDAKAAGLPLTPSLAGINEMIERCSFLGSDTYVEEIRFLERFQYLKIQQDGISVETIPYHDDLAVPADEDALIEMIDTLFTEACSMAVEKNRSEGYRQLFTLSSGMDSRCAFLKSMPFCKAEQEITPLCITYGSSGCMDIQIAAALAHSQHCDLLIHETNPTGFVRDREAILDSNEGMMYYAGTTGLSGMLRALDTTAFGLALTGLGGGEIMGDLGKDGSDEELYRQLFAALDADAQQARISALAEIPYNEYVCYQDIRTCLNFAYTASHAFEAFSPFLYEDLFLLLLKTPRDSKRFRRLYAKWYLQKIGDPTPTSSFQGPVEVTSRTAPKQLFKGAMRRIRRKLHIQGKWDMNPMEVWMKQHPENLAYMAETLQQDIDTFRKKYPQLAETLQNRYAAADADTKLRILTVSGMFRRMAQ